MTPSSCSFEASPPGTHFIPNTSLVGDRDQQVSVREVWLSPLLPAPPASLWLGEEWPQGLLFFPGLRLIPQRQVKPGSRKELPPASLPAQSSGERPDQLPPC